MTALAEEWNSRSSNIGDSLNRRQKFQDMEDSHTENDHPFQSQSEAHIPQWKRDFLMKKKALLLHQQEQEIRRAQKDGSVLTSHGRYDCIVDSDKPNNGDLNDNHHRGNDTDSSTDGKSHLSLKGDVTHGHEQNNSSDSNHIHTSYSDTDSTSTNASDLQYQRGFVSKLLNKWTKISHKKSVSDSLPLKSTSQSQPAMANHSVRSPVKQFNGRQAFSRKERDRHSSMSSYYRDPVEIVLIENGQPTSEVTSHVNNRRESLIESPVSDITATSSIKESTATHHSPRSR